MKLSPLDLFKNKELRKCNAYFSAIIEMFKRDFCKIFSENQGSPANKDELEYWRNYVYSFISMFLIVGGTPLWLYGAYLFFSQGYIVHALIEVILSIIISVIITKKSLCLGFRKLFIVSLVYSASILLLITTGPYGAGMVCVFFSLILAGCLLTIRQAYRFIIVNLAVFAAITVSLVKGYFDGTYMSDYNNVWPINLITTQAFGIVLVILINKVYKGLENQTQLIKKSSKLLITSETKHKAMIANISDVIVIISETGVVEYTSPNMEQRYGWTLEDFAKKTMWKMAHPEDEDYVKKEFGILLKNYGMEKTLETRCISRNGSVKYIEATAINLLKDPVIKGILVSFHDVTEYKMREEEILYLSYHDGLTGLYNRTFFEEEKKRLDRERETSVSIIIGDINGLKIINDSLGHAEGDKLLVAIAKILADCCGKEGVLARIGGDEFGILLSGRNSGAVLDVVKKINEACEEYNKKVTGELNYTSISLGYAAKTSDMDSLDSVQKIAEDNMYKRKLLEGRSLHSALIASMKTALQAKSQETEAHAQRLVMLSKAVGQDIGLTAQQFDELELFAQLHDIGKIGIDDQILNKPGKLTDEEWVEMKKHCEIGYRIAMSSPELVPIAKYILTHHERWDGKGYPQELSGEDIPLLSRIVAVIDAYDAMTEDRPYRKGMPQEAAINEIIKNAGEQFDPDITKIFTKIISDTTTDL